MNANSLLLERIKKLERRMDAIEANPERPTWDNLSSRFIGQRLTIESLADLVALYYNIPAEVMLDSCREDSGEARKVFCYFSYRYANRVGGYAAAADMLNRTKQVVRHHYRDILNQSSVYKHLPETILRISSVAETMI